MPFYNLLSVSTSKKDEMRKTRLLKNAKYDIPLLKTQNR